MHLLFLSLFLALLTIPSYTLAQEFVSLTGLPGLQGIGGAETLPAFFNALYRICVGAAATLAVIQIIRAGIKWMAAGDNVGATKEARSLIVNAIFGLLLVLSPAIVFGVIDPRILDLRLDAESLQLGEASFGSGVEQ